MSERCACGQALHYTDASLQAAVQRFIEDLGPTVRVRTPDGAWLVPRHYIALHGIAAKDLPQLAARYGWARDTNRRSEPS